MSTAQSRAIPTATEEAVENETQDVGDLDQWNSNMDRKLKNRIQNRLSQRTYRNRLRQRIEDLEQQVQQMDARTATSGQHSSPHEINQDENPDDMIESRDLGSVNNDVSLSTEDAASTSTCQPGKNHSGSLQGLLSTNMAVINPFNESTFGISAPVVHDPLQGIPVSPLGGLTEDYETLWRDGPPWQSESADSAAAGEPVFSHVPMGNIMNGISQASSSTGMPLGYNLHEPKTKMMNQDNNNTNINPNPEISGHSQTVNSAWTRDQSSHHLTSDEIVPSSDSAFEDRVEWLLNCARRVGFDGLDDLATKYYTRDFDPKSSLVLEQRMSRNRSLPKMLVELCQSSSKWPAWQSRAYMEEILKSAEDICDAECNDLVKQLAASGDTKAAMTEIALQDKMPYLWAFLTRLASKGPNRRNVNHSRLVYVSLLVLCGVQINSTFLSHIDQLIKE